MLEGFRKALYEKLFRIRKQRAKEKKEREDLSLEAIKEMFPEELDYINYMVADGWTPYLFGTRTLAFERFSKYLPTEDGEEIKGV